MSCVASTGSMPRKERRSYTEDFKKAAVERVEAGEKLNYVAKELNVSIMSLQTWRKEFGGRRQIVERLKTQLAIAQLENEFLKKYGNKPDPKAENEFLKKKLALLEK